MTIRSARTDDAGAVTSVFLRARADAMPYLPRLHSDEQTATWISTIVLSGPHVWVAHTASQVVGFAAVEDGLLEHLYVDPTWQGRGVGSLLLGQAQAGRGRLDLFVFTRNTAARAFYERHGFALAELRDGSANEEGEPDARYRWLRSHP